MLKITLLCFGNKMPTWINQGVAEYTKRLREHCLLNFLEIPLLHRSKQAHLEKILEKEALMMQEAIPPQSYVIALDSKGESFHSEELADKLSKLKMITSHIVLLIGGPEGLATHLLQQANAKWSLSKLTLPHPLVRIIVLEALYRAFSILNHHPYHK